MRATTKWPIGIDKAPAGGALKQGTCAAPVIVRHLLPPRRPPRPGCQERFAFREIRGQTRELKLAALGQPRAASLHRPRRQLGVNLAHFRERAGSRLLFVADVSHFLRPRAAARPEQVAQLRISPVGLLLFLAHMTKKLLTTSCSLLCVASLHAQSEPGKSPAVGEAKPPTVHNAANPPAEQSPPPVAATPAAVAETSGQPKIDKNPPPLDPKNMDTSVKPGDDFYRYANGNWLKNNPVPPEFSRWGSFNELLEKNNDALHEIAEKAAKLAPEKAGESKIEKAASAELQKVGDFYASGMDEEAINAAGIKPLQDELQKIEALSSKEDLVKEMGHLHDQGIPVFFGFTSGQDDKNSTMVIAQAYQGGLGLPDRDYYTKEDDASKKLRDGYIAHMTKVFALLGDSEADAAKHAKTVMEIETSLAKPARTRVELRDPQKNYNKMTAAELQKLMPDFKWDDYFKQLDLAAVGSINVGQPDFFKAANGVFKSVSLDDWKTYLRWHLVHSIAPALSKDFVDENFDFYSKTLTGAQKLKPRWKRVVAATDNEIGEALGKLYVADHFPPDAKARALEMVENLKAALSDRIKAADWMDDKTKAEAQKKLAAFSVKIGG